MPHSKHPHLTHPKYRPDIDGLRAIAILPVVLFHAFPSIIPGGFTGVDIFFVISGYLISTIIFSSLEHDRFSLLEFYIRRIRRIFPALIIVLFSCLLLGWFVLIADEYRQLSKHVAAGAGFIQNFILWNEIGYFDNSSDTKPLLHLWSLAIEEQFYILWPLLLAFIWKRHWSFLRITLAIAVISFLTNLYLTNSNLTAAFYSPISRFWELMVGGVLAYATLHRPMLLDRQHNIQSVLGFILLLLGFIILNTERDFPGWWALFPTLGAFLIISAGPNAWLNKNLLASRLMVWIGLLSYPLYLWHWPLLSYLRIVDNNPTQLKIAGALGLAVLLSWLTYSFAEKPWRSDGNPRKKSAILLVILIIIGSSGVTSLVNNGFPGRDILWSDVTPNPYDHEAGYRHQKCFLDGTSGNRFSDICSGDSTDKPTVFLWGDSHAASLYRGFLQQSHKLNFNLAQYTTSGCPPVVDFEMDSRPECKWLNNYVLEKIKATKPDTVVLSAYWLLYDGKHEIHGSPWNYMPKEKLVNTISILKSIGINNIVVIGQLPAFHLSQIKVGAKQFVAGDTNRTFYAYVIKSIAMDHWVHDIANTSNVDFLSPIETLCNDSGCLISTSLEKFIPLAWDDTHMTTDGAEFFIQSAIRNHSLTLPKNN